MKLIEETNRIYAMDDTGKLLAEITFPEMKAGVFTINHTFVDESLRGQGVANILMSAMVKKAIAEHKKIVATCSYAENWLKKHPLEME